MCKNEDNVQVVFNYDFAPFFLVSCDGIMSVYNNVATSENTMIDGSTYQGSTTKERYIVITAQMCDNYKENREMLYRAFKPKSTGAFTYIEDDEQRTIDYKVESVEIAEVGVVRNIIISLKCPDPFFKALEDSIVEMAAWDNLFEFEHEFIEEGEALADRVAEIIKEIPNESAAANIGITITFVAEGPVTNPAIYHVESGDYVKVNIALNAGDSIIITTETNNKNVYLIRDGVKTEINERLDEDSEFMQLSHGMNTLKYDADSGIDYLNVKISYRFRYLGV
jgi:hypothetical protein